MSAAKAYADISTFLTHGWIQHFFPKTGQ